MLTTEIEIYILLSLFIILFIWIIYLHRRLSKALVGKSQTLDQSIEMIQKSIIEIKNSDKEIENYLESAEKRIKRSAQAVATIRFNPFQGTGMGGNQSFATSIINEAGDGVVISSLYTRERTSVFAKPVKNFKSEFELSSEEKQAISSTKKIIDNS